jgi:DNA repair protein SbcC/Rad50
MIPIRLELHNFLPYRAPDPIVFDGIALACLTGQNGAGKSSLLDAISWSLWGKARSKRDDELIHLGQSDMHVQLDFEQEGTLYRVLRRRTRSGRSSKGALDLMILREDDSPMIINEVSSRQTQHKINGILRLDYDTFVNSAFLQQGRADAFTVKTPAERKKILSDILGLDQWMGYEDKVKATLSDISRQIDIINHDVDMIDDEIAKEPQYKRELADATLAYDEANANLKIAEEQLDKVANSEDALRRENENLIRQQGVITQRQDDITSAQGEIERQQEKIAEYQATIDQAETIAEGYQQLLTARENQSAITEQLTQMKDLDDQYNRLDKELTDKKSALESDKSAILARIDGLEKQTQSADANDLEAIRQEVDELQTLDTQRDKTTQAIQKMKEERSGLTATLDALKAEGIGLNERLDNLEAADGATCPLCGQALTEEHRNEILAELTLERDTKREDYRAYQERIEEIKVDSKEQQKQVDSWVLQLKNLPALQQRFGALEEQVNIAQKAEEDLHVEATKLEQVEDTLSNETYGEEIRAQMTQIEEQRQRIGYDPDSHEDVKSQLETYREFDRQNTQLEFAQMNLPEAQGILDNVQTRLEKLQTALKDDEQKCEQIKDEMAVLEVKVTEEKKLRTEVARFRTTVQSLNERKTIAQQELNAIEARREQKKRLQKRLDETLHEQGLYNDLKTAFGKNGVPAMIIETAIPELEAESNDLLSRMTDGRMTLRLNTQREKVSGGVSETLDIEIADELGTRGYEMYSGGEAFRINFAIRVALSKMLARRAGAHLRTLFIDEGFGSQDDDGRNKLVEAINTIQADFDMILVITHIEELRDSFPVHVVVDKTNNGSMVSVR